MKNKIISAGVVALMAMAPCAYGADVVAPAKPAKAKFVMPKAVTKTAFYVKKTLLLPVYVGLGSAAGACIGGVVWYHLGGKLGQVAKDVKTISELTKPASK